MTDLTEHASNSKIRRPLAGQVHDVLSEMLLSGALAPGDRMSMRELAEKLGVSVMPVREAVTRLVARGALSVAPNRAVRVPVLSRAEFQDLTEIRIHNESFAARLAAAHITPGEEPRLRMLENAFRDSMKSHDVREAVRTNKALHFDVYARSGSPMLTEVISVLWLKAGPIINLDVGQQVRRSRNAASVENHRKLVDALIAGDGDAAAAALAEDIRSAADFILSRDILGRSEEEI